MKANFVCYLMWKSYFSNLDNAVIIFSINFATSMVTFLSDYKRLSGSVCIQSIQWFFHQKTPPKNAIQC